MIVIDTLKNNKITTKFEPSDDGVVIYKANLYKKLSKTEGHLLFSEKDYNEFKLNNSKQSVGEI